MPEFILKGGDKPPIEMVEYLKENREDYLRVNIEVESTHERLRRSFHVLLKEWFLCGEWSCNGAEIYTFDKFRDYYKYAGCNYKAIGYTFNGDTFDNLELLFNAYPKANSNIIRPVIKSWVKMTKKEKSTALNLLFTEIRLSMTNNQKVLEWVGKITGDIDLLNDINYHKNIGE